MLAGDAGEPGAADARFRHRLRQHGPEHPADRDHRLLLARSLPDASASRSARPTTSRTSTSGWRSSGSIAYTAAFVCEALRSGHQHGAGRSGGGGAGPRAELHPGARALIVLPQAFRSVVDPLANVLIALTKNTTVAAAIGVAEAALLMKEMIENEAQLVLDLGDLRVRIRRSDPSDRPDPRLGRQASGGEAMTSVLYDAPGPGAKRRNIVYTVVVPRAARRWRSGGSIGIMDDKGQLDWAKWKPFFTERRGLDDLPAARSR